MDPTLRLRHLLALLMILLAATLAGCTDAGEPADEGSGDEPDGDAPGGDAPAEGDDGPETPPGDTTTAPQTAGERFRAAFDALREDKGAPPVYLVEMNGITLETAGHAVKQTLYVDSTGNRTYYRFHHTDAEGDVVEDELTAMLDHTLFEGRAEESLVAMHDPDAPAFTLPTEFSEAAGRLPSFMPTYLTFSSMMMQGGVLYAPIQEPEAEEVEVDGVEAERLTFEQDRMVVLMQKEPSRILSIQKEANRASGGTVNVTANITYDAAPPAALGETLARAGTLTALNQTEWITAVRGEYDDETTRAWTLKPNATAARVALGEVELRVHARGGLDEAPLLALPLETGAAESAALRLSFEDADGDGHASAGDVLRLEILDAGREAGDYEIRLADEATGALILLK